MSADGTPQPEPAAQEGNGEPLAVPTLEDLLVSLRHLAGPCEPPIGVGAFDVLYANVREVVVWYSPVRPEHRPGEVTVPTAWLAAAWQALVGGEPVDEASLVAHCEGRAGAARWVQALLAQAPGVGVAEIVEGQLVLTWSVSAWQAALNRRMRQSDKTTAVTIPARRRRSRSRGAN